MSSDPELVTDLLDRAIAEKLEADLRKIDSTVAIYHKKLAGRLPWSTFEAPSERRAA